MELKEIPVETNLGYREFVKKYLEPCRPVIIKDALKHLPANNWTPENLKEKYGDKVFVVDGEDVAFGDFVDVVLSSTPENPAPYLRNVGIETDFQELMTDLQPGFSYTRSNWRLLPFFPNWYFEDKSIFVQMFFTGAGRSFPWLHVDYPPMHTFTAMVHGRKEWIMFERDQEPYFYSTKLDDCFPEISKVDDPFEPDLEKFPEFDKASGFKAIQQQGDLLFIPCGWWHTARSLSPSISLAWDHLSATSWQRYMMHMQSTPSFEAKGPVYKALVRNYIALVCKTLAVRDSFMLPFRRDEECGRILQSR